MRICVLIKQVPDQESVLKINADQTWIIEDNLVFTANESDTYALEEALLLKESLGGEVVVCTLGPERSGQVLKDALAKGADRAMFLQDEAFDRLDSQGAAKVLAKALGAEQFDLILLGLQADDTGDAQLGPILAEELDLPHVTLVVATEVLDGRLKVKQEQEGGWYQHIEVDLPALLTIQSGINKPRYASLRGIMAMKSKEIKQVTAADLGMGADDLTPDQSIAQLYIPPKTKDTVFLEGSPDEMVSQLVEKLANEAKVL
ncbi:MAG: electron transfer flavoprotein subunit beta/FixA family protein [Fidelibacterota bacterium]|nr:MAG: electron transfer flavoprotein subunit beta/FixA family protein [Candidatus Neomarinimicrobiota bacterium]